MVSKTDLVEVDALVRFLDAAIGKVLEAIAQVKLAAIAETCANTDMIAELKGASKIPVCVYESGRYQMKADGSLRVGRKFARVFLLQTEYRRNARIGNGLVVAGRATSAPAAQRGFPVSGHQPVAPGEPLLIPVPGHADERHISRIAIAVFNGCAVHGKRITAEEQRNCQQANLLHRTPALEIGGEPYPRHLQ